MENQTTEEKDSDVFRLPPPEEPPPLPESVRHIGFSELGLNVAPQLQPGPLGMVRSLSSFTPLEWAYLALSTLSLLASFGMTIERLVNLPGKSADITLAMVLLLSTIFCFYYVFHGVLKERPYELMVFVCTTLIVLFYCILNYFFGVQGTMKLVRLIVAAVVGPVLIGCGVYLSRRYYTTNNLIFRTVGADLNDQSMCRTMFLYSSLLKFDLQLEGSMIILVIYDTTVFSLLEILVLSVGGAMAIVWVVIGFLLIKYEDMRLAVAFVATSLFEPAYTLFRMAVVKADAYPCSECQIIAVTTYLCGSFSLVVRIALMITVVFVIRNFGRGLKEKVYGQQPR